MSSSVGISSEPLDPAAALRAVAGPGRGGTVLFTGQVRDEDGGAEVVELEYVAHPSAATELEAVVRSVHEQVPDVALTAVHRVGVLAVGDLAVVVAAGAAHRDEAFRAARLLIDQLKERVPIWKRQRFRDGNEEWVGAPAVADGAPKSPTP